MNNKSLVRIEPNNTNSNSYSDEMLKLNEKTEEQFPLKDFNYLIKQQQITLQDIEIFTRLFQTEPLENRIFLLSLTLKSDPTIFSIIPLKLFLLKSFSEWLSQYEEKSRVQEICKQEKPEKIWEFMTALLCVCEKIPMNENDLRTYKIGKKINKLEKNIDNQPTIKVKCKKLVGIWKKEIEMDRDDKDKFTYESSNSNYRNEYLDRSASKNRNDFKEDQFYDDPSDNSNTAAKDSDDMGRYDRDNESNQNYDDSLINKKRERQDRQDRQDESVSSFNDRIYNPNSSNAFNSNVNSNNNNSISSPMFSHGVVNSPHFNNNNLNNLKINNQINPNTINNSSTHTNTHTNINTHNNNNPNNNFNPINHINPQIFNMLQKTNQIPLNINYQQFLNNLNMVKNNQIKINQMNQNNPNNTKGNSILDQNNLSKNKNLNINTNITSKSILKKTSNISSRYSKQQPQQKKTKIKFEDDRMLEKIKIFKISDEPDCNEVSEEEYIKIQKEILSNPNYKHVVADMRMREISMEKENINKARDKLKLAKESLKNMVPQAFAKQIKEVYKGEHYDLADSTESTEKMLIKSMNSNCLAVNYYKELDIPACPKIKEEKMFDFCDESIPKLENEYSTVDLVQAEKEKAKQVVMKQINDFIVENKIQPEISVKLQNKIQQLENFSVEDLPELYSSINNELYSMSNHLNSFNFPKPSISNTTNIPNPNIGNYTFPNKGYSNLPNVNVNSGNGRFAGNFPKNFPVNSGGNMNINSNYNHNLNSNFKHNSSYNHNHSNTHHSSNSHHSNSNVKGMSNVNSNMNYNTSNYKGNNMSNENSSFTSPGSHFNNNNILDQSLSPIFNHNNTNNNNNTNTNTNDNNTNNNVNSNNHMNNYNIHNPNSNNHIHGIHNNFSHNNNNNFNHSNHNNHYNNNNSNNNNHHHRPRIHHNNEGGFRESKMDPTRYKTKPCNKFHGPIGCTFDEKCFFIHDQRYKGMEIPNFEPENYRDESYKGPPSFNERIGINNTNTNTNNNNNFNSGLNANSNFNPNFQLKSGFIGNSNYQK